MIDIKKALDTSSGANIIPEKLDKLLLDVVSKTNPLRAYVPSMAWSTLVYLWNVRTALVTASAYDEDDAYSAANSTIARRTTQIKMIKAEGAVSNLLKAVSGDYINALQEEVESATNSLAMEEARLDILGDASVNVKEYSGLKKLVTTTTDAAGTALSLDILDASIAASRKAGAFPNVILLSPRDYSQLKKAAKTSYQMYYNDLGKSEAVLKYDGIDVVINSWIPEDIAYGTSPTSDHSIAFVLDTKHIKRPVVQEVKYAVVPASTDSTAFRINEYLTLAVKDVERQRQIINIGKPS